MLYEKQQKQDLLYQQEKPEFQSQEHQLMCHQEQQQQQQSDVDVALDAGQFVSSASDGIGGQAVSSPDDGGRDSIASQSLSDRQVLGGTNVTLTVLACDDDEDDDDDDRTTPVSAVDRGHLQPAARPTRLALCEPDHNGTLSPSESLETPSRSTHLLAMPRKSSPTPSLRGSWLDLTKQFIMDRRKCLSPESKVGDH